MPRLLLPAILVGWLALALGCDRPPGSAPAASTPAKEPQATQPATGPAQSTAAILAEEPSAQKPFVAAAGLRPAQGQRGDTVELVIQARTAASWHIYAADGPRGIGAPTSLELKLPEGVEPAGAWEYPRARPGAEGQGTVYEGELVFRRLLRINDKAKPGPIEIQCELRYQACDPFRCRPPETLTLFARGEVVPTR